MLFADPMAMHPAVIAAVRIPGDFPGCVCVFWPPVKGELLIKMRYQYLVFTSMMSPPYPRSQ
jgi:hypothetical protein